MHVLGGAATAPLLTASDSVHGTSTSFSQEIAHTHRAAPLCHRFLKLCRVVGRALQPRAAARKHPLAAAPEVAQPPPQSPASWPCRWLPPPAGLRVWERRSRPGPGWRRARLCSAWCAPRRPAMRTPRPRERGALRGWLGGSAGGLTALPPGGRRRGTCRSRAAPRGFSPGQCTRCCRPPHPPLGALACTLQAFWRAIGPLSRPPHVSRLVPTATQPAALPATLQCRGRGCADHRAL